MIVILSRDVSLYSTRALRSAFENAGKNVEVLDVLQLEVKVGRGVFLNGKELVPELVIPRFSAQILVAGLAVIREWEMQFVPILNSSAGIAIAHDQLASLQCLHKAGLPIPATSFCSQPEGSETYQSLAGDSAKVIKLLDSSQGRGVTLAKDEMTKASVLSTLASLRSSGLTQRYYEEAQGRDYRLIVFQAEVVAAISRISRPDDFRANVHQGASVENYIPTEFQKAIAIRAVGAMGLDFAGVDVLPTNEGDLVLEVNASPGLQGVEQGDFCKVASLITAVL